MATSNPSAIRLALHATLANLTPEGTTLGNAKYVRNSKYHRQAGRPRADRDRQFNISRIKVAEQLDFGSHSEAMKRGTFDLWIGHVRGPDYDVGGGRRDRDNEQIQAFLEWPSNNVTGVQLITFTDYGQQHEDQMGWDDQLFFEILFLGVPKWTPTP